MTPTTVLCAINRRDSNHESPQSEAATLRPVPIYFTSILLCGQSYKAFTSVNYDSMVVITSKLLTFRTLDS